MKKGLIFCFILLLFSQCEKSDNADMPAIQADGQHKVVPSGQSGNGRYQVSNDQPSLSKAPSKKNKKAIKREKTFPGKKGMESITSANNPSDSLFINQLKRFRSSNIEPDLNEPVSTDYLFSLSGGRKFPSMITLSKESFFRVNFDNDILDYTDRFYTNGIKIDIINPVFRLNPLSHLLLPYWSSGINYYGLSLVQNMYTPSTTKSGGIPHGDRPYAAYLYAGSFKITNDEAHLIRQTSELDIGIIGSYSYGEWVQRSFHNSVPTNNEPLGWEYQVENDLILNYSVALEKGVVNGRNIDLVVFSRGSLGTLHTNLAVGSQVRTGLLNPYFTNLGIARKKDLDDAGLRRFQLFFFVRGSAKLVGYDATLQGGMLNQSSPYTIPAEDISRVVFEGSGGVSLSYNGIKVDLEQFLLSPEFHQGLWHKWVHVAFTFCL
jgi:hypothetical protein